MTQSLLFPVFLLGAAVFTVVVGLTKYFTRDKTRVLERAQTYTGIEEEAAVEAAAEMHSQSPVTRLLNVILGRGFTKQTEEKLAQADIPMRVSEFVLLRLVLAGVGFLIGLSPFFGFKLAPLVFGIIGFLIPPIFVNIHHQRRREKFVRQLADALMLLTNSLRSGYSFLKGLELVAKEMGDPIAKELHRMLREVNLGATVDDALQNLGRRVKSDDLDIVISAYLVQKEVGGNLNEIMEKVAETIRERLRIQGDVRVLTAQGKMSGAIVGLLPFFVFFWLFMTNPGYFDALKAPSPFIVPSWIPIFGSTAVPWGVLLGSLALTLQGLGIYIILKIVRIKV